MVEGHRIYHNGSYIAITNVMAKITCAPFDLQCISTIDGATFHQGRYRRISFKLTACHCNIYATGSVVFLGCKTIQSIQSSIEELASILEEHFFPIDIEPIVQNIAAKVVLSFGKISLENFCSKFDDHLFQCSYEPELSNAAHFSFDPFIKVLLHPTGKGIVTGLKSTEEAVGILRQIVSLLESD
jgi:TATA-box binding protein (TBP) (component of TFIID and TFIIIB)